MNPSSEIELPPAADSNEKRTPVIDSQASVLGAQPISADILHMPPTPRVPVSQQASAMPSQAAAPPPVAAAVPEMRSFNDARAIRKNIFDRVLAAARSIQPVSNSRHTLRLVDVDYQDGDKLSKKQQKQAILNNLTPSRRLSGTWELVDNQTGEIIDKKRSVVMRVPHFTDRGTFINKGVEYALKNQQRLLPGVYTRVQSNGDIETMANIMPGKGPSHRYYLDPEKGTFKIKIGQGTVGLLPLLKTMGVADKDIQEAWGGKLYAANLRSDNAAEYAKLRSKFLNATELQKPIAEQEQLLRDKFVKMELDPEVTKRTLGQPFQSMTSDAILAITKKLIGVSKGEEEVDDRDSLAYQRFYGPEDLLAERIERDKDGIRKAVLWKMSNKGNLKSMPSSVLTPQLQSALISSGLGLALEEINPTEILDKMTSTTRMGEGGIASADAIPAEARSVQPSMLNFIDPLRTPECYDRETEVRTRRGWVKWPDVSEDDEFACLVDGWLYFRKASRLIREQYKGPMYGVTTGTTSYLVTPNHRLWVAEPREDAVIYRVVPAELCHGKKYFLHTGLYSNGTEWSSPDHLIDPTQESCKSYVVDDFDDEVFCATVPGGLLYVRRGAPIGHWSGNSSKVGIDVYTARGAMKGSDGKLYSKFLDVRTGEEVYKNPQQVSDLTVGFPDALRSQDDVVPAMRKGRMSWVKKSDIDLIVPRMEDALNPMSNLIPMKSQTKGQRLVMASRMLSQALPLVDAEAPLVQSAVPGAEGRESFESMYGNTAGSIRADKPGQVISIDADEIRVRYADGTEDTHELYNSFPLNRKTLYSQQPLVAVGDTFKPGQLLAKSNFTDKTGAIAVGKNARTAYMVSGGSNFEDAITISRSFAERMRSEHMYQHQLETDDKTLNDKKKYLQLFPGTYNKETLAKMDDNGVIRPGTEVKYGDPLVLGITQKEASHNRIHRKGATNWSDATVTWEHHDPGVVTDVAMTSGGPLVVVKSTSAMQVGDKLSGRIGDKGVIGAIIDDEDMPKGEDGRPYEVLLNPLSVVTRVNPTQMSELFLGKIAEKLGRPIAVEDFDSEKEMDEWVREQLRENGIKDLEDVLDPTTGRKIKGIATGNRFFMKLHHMSEGKLQGRSGGAYSMDESPAKGGVEGAKRMGLLESSALLAHGGLANLQDASIVRGQRNDQYWAQFMSGHNPTAVKIPFAYKKFVNQLKAAGINVVPDGQQIHIMAMTDKDIAQLAGDREITSAEGVDWAKGMKEIEGGLFDKSKTGGHSGNHWSFFKLSEPMPNPVMEEPIRKLLGLTGKKFEAILAGQEELKGHGTGPRAIKSALEAINIDREIESQRAIIRAGKVSYRDAAIKKLGLLKSAKQLGIHPSEYMLTKVPVLPPMFRPIAMMGNELPLIDDANHLYKELFEANKNLARVSSLLGPESASEERVAVYNAFKAVTGLGDPIGAKNQEQGVKGILSTVFGSSPKYSMLQRKLLSTTVDNVGRGVITPNPSFDMDTIGIPENSAYKIYDRPLTRRLVRRGMSVMAARQEIENRSKLAQQALLEEMEERPVLASRAPVLHKYGIMAFRPKLVKSNSLEVSPLIVAPYNADFDGNCCDFDTELLLLFNQSPLQSGGLLLESWSEGHIEPWKEMTMRTCGKSLVELINGGNAFKVKIGEIPRVGEPMRGKDNQEIYDLPPGLSVLSYDPATCKPVYTPITKITIDRNHACREVKTRSGREVIVSDNESLCVFDSELGQVRKMAPADSVGKLSPVIRKYPEIGSKFSFELGWLYSVLAADGWKQTRTLGYSKNDSGCRAEVERIVREHISDAFSKHEYHDANKTSKFGDSVKIHLNGMHMVSKVLDFVHPDHADNPQDRAALYKKYPDEVLYGGSRECLLGMLSGAIDGDASVGWNKVQSKRRFFCRFNTSSRYLRDSIFDLLLRLGIRYSLTVTPPRNNSKESYIICPSVIDLAKVLPECRIVHAERRQIIAEFLEEAQNTEFRDNLDIVPISKDLAQCLCSLIYPAHKTLYAILQKAKKVGTLGRDSARRIKEIVGDIDHPHFAAFCTIADNDDITWHLIESAEVVPPRDVFDLEVPETKVFAVNNGLIIWDTMNFHVPATDKAVEEAYERLLPSKNLFKLSDMRSVAYAPKNEFVAGLHHATKSRSDRPVRIFRSVAELREAYAKKTIAIDDPVQILEQ